MQEKPLYITTTLPYVNADPHVGHALEFVQADCFARFSRAQGRGVFFNIGTDEHGQKIYEKACQQDVSPQDFVDKYATRFQNFAELLEISYTNFIRTTEEHHKQAAQEFWRRCDEKGDIYKKMYEGLYCVGCEMFVTKKDLVDGQCPHHPGTEPEKVEEENYFFRFSEYEQMLLDLYEQAEDFVIPKSRQNEIHNFVQSGLEDFSVSRRKERMPWGVEVPEDKEQVMYVWFDALTNYISTLGWPEDSDKFVKFWQEGEVVQFAGKDNLRQQSAMWQAMLMSAGLQPSTHIVIHGFITSKGQKMSKTVGNVIDPVEYAEKYGTDALRYFLLRHIQPFEDSDFTEDKFVEVYNAHLANGIGNLLSRLMKMYVSYDVEVAFPDPEDVWSDEEHSDFIATLRNFEFCQAADYLWEGVDGLDHFIAEKEPYKVVKENKKKAQAMVAYAVMKLYEIAILLEPFMPDTSEKILQTLLTREQKEVLFERIG